MALSFCDHSVVNVQLLVDCGDQDLEAMVVRSEAMVGEMVGEIRGNDW